MQKDGRHSMIFVLYFNAIEDRSNILAVMLNNFLRVRAAQLTASHFHAKS